MGWITYQNSITDIEYILKEIDPKVPSPTLNTNDTLANSTGDAKKITAGIYVTNIKSISLTNNNWSTDFFLWFKWTGDIGYDPGANFRVVDGKIDSKNLIKNITNGNEHYELYEISATINQVFDVLRFPLDDQYLHINIQDKNLNRQNLLYVPDTNASSLAKDIKVSGYEIGPFIIVEKADSYGTNLGDSTMNSTTFSQLRAGFLLSRSGTFFITSALIAIFVAVFAALASLLIKPDFLPARIGTEASALFIGVTNLILVQNLVPSGTLTIATMINALGLGIISFTLIVTLFSISYHHQGREEFSKKFDRRILLISSISFVLIVLLLVFTGTDLIYYYVIGKYLPNSNLSYILLNFL